jgi:mRNA interferase HicA
MRRMSFAGQESECGLNSPGRAHVVNTSVDHATHLLHTVGGDEPRAQAVAHETGCLFEPGRGGHLTVRLGDKITDLPMHGKKRDLPTGTVNAIKKALGLK